MVASVVNNGLGLDVKFSARSGHMSGLRAGGEAPLHNFNGPEAAMDICCWEQLWLRLTVTGFAFLSFSLAVKGLLATCLKWLPGLGLRGSGYWLLDWSLIKWP